MKLFRFVKPHTYSTEPPRDQTNSTCLSRCKKIGYDSGTSGTSHLKPIDDLSLKMFCFVFCRNDFIN